jgi:hypothetical protein
MVAKGKGKSKWNWHDIAILVVPIEGELETSPFRALERLRELGLAVQTFPTSAKMDKWEISALGEQILQNQLNQNNE